MIEDLDSAEWFPRAEKLSEIVTVHVDGVTTDELLKLAKQQFRWGAHFTANVLAFGEGLHWEFFKGKWYTIHEP